MKRKPILLILVAIFLIAAVLVCFFNKEQIMEKTGFVSAYADNGVQSCNCETNWFPHEKTPAPAEGNGSPFDSSTTTNCDFHQWSWQKFLWLTKPMSNGNPLFLDSLEVVTPQLENVVPELGLKLVLSSIKQAGRGAVLVSNSKYNNATDTVFYSIHVNKLLKDKAISAASQINKGILPVSNLETFPVRALELKISWIDINAIPKQEQANYYTTKAAVADKKGNYVEKTVAMLGMHVVGVVKNHPEFIWATFEHSDMAPIYDKKSNSVTSAKEMLFYEKGPASGVNPITWDKKIKGPVVPNKAFILYDYGVPKDLNTGDFMKTSQAEPANFNNIKEINKCVASNLKDVFKNYFYNGSVWLDFDGVSSVDQAKAIVTKDISSALPDSLARGSVNLANITMETYTQTFETHMDSINNGNLVSCFFCHQASNFDTSRPGKSPLFLSHIFGDHLKFTRPKSGATAKNIIDTRERRIEEIDALKMKQLEDFIKKN